MEIHDITTHLQALFTSLSTHLSSLPGSAIVVRYIKSSYQNDPVRSAVELFLFLFAVRYLLAPKYSTKKRGGGFVKLSDAEVDELVEEWTPEPLVAKVTQAEEAENEKRVVIVGPTGPKTKLSTGRTVTNLASYNHFALTSNETLKERAIQTLRTYGVGPCGPPGFYGTQDVHMKTEADIASFLSVPACIVYAQAFSTISSVIPAFSKRGDIIVADAAVNFAIRKGCQISRSQVRFFAHNDAQDLERVLRAVTREQARKPLTRRFIVTEGLFEADGSLSPLPDILALKKRYKFRLILDETWSFGVLGRTGRGATEYHNCLPGDQELWPDMQIGSLAGSLCAGGGFCAGSEEIVEHQRISAAAYTFSAALPAMLATTASETLAMIQTQPELLAGLRENVRALRAAVLSGGTGRGDMGFECLSDEASPIIYLAVKEDVVEQKGWGPEDEEAVIREVLDECLAQGVLVTRVRGMPRGQMAAGGSAKDGDEGEIRPAVKVCVTVGLSRRECEKAGAVVRGCFGKVMGRRR